VPVSHPKEVNKMVTRPVTKIFFITTPAFLAGVSISLPSLRFGSNRDTEMETHSRYALVPARVRAKGMPSAGKLYKNKRAPHVRIVEINRSGKGMLCEQASCL